MISTNESYRDIAITRSGKDPADVTVVRTGPDPDKLQRGSRMRASAAGAGTWPRTSASWVPRTAWTSWSGPPASSSTSWGATDIAFTLIGKGDCFDELVALRDELKLNGHVEFTGRAPDELVKKVMSTADIGLSPDPMNPLNDVSTMNKTMEYMSFELPVVAFDLRETRVSAADAAVYVKPTGSPEQESGTTPRRSWTSSTTPTSGRGWASSAGPGSRRSSPGRIRSGPTWASTSGIARRRKRGTKAGS